MSQTTTQTLDHPTSIPSSSSTTVSHPRRPPPAAVPQFANFNYYLPPPDPDPLSKPTTDDLKLILGTKNADTRRLPVHDLRGRFDEFELDRCGFCVAKLESKEMGFKDDERIRRVYYPEIEGLLREL
jgi:hypothetical protein